jgi:hypothetical protein
MKYLLVFSVAAVIFCGCCKKEYSVVLLGDLHYDKLGYHDTNIMKFKPHMDYIEGTKNKDGNFSLRNHTFWTTKSKNLSMKNVLLNEKMWQKYVPDILDAAAFAAKENRSVFAVQLGDLIHGDCGTEALHKKNLQDAASELDRRFGQNVFILCGNHDSRGPGGEAAWDSVMMPYLQSIAKNRSSAGMNYFMRIGKDLFYFHDLMNPDVDFMEKVFKENADARYTFFFTHVIVLPMDRGSFNSILSDDFHRIFALLEKRDAIILAAHTHRISLTRYHNKADGHRMSQFVLNSTVRNIEKQKNFVPDDSARRTVFQPEEFYKMLWKRYFEGKLETPVHADGAGFAVLRISEDGVYAEYHNVGQDKPYIFKLR